MSPAINNGLHFADVVKTFGAHGELLIRLRSEAPEEINLSEPVFIIIEGYAVPFYFKRFEARGNHRALVIFDDMESMELAQELAGKPIELKRKNDKRKNQPASASPFSLLHYHVVDEKAGEIGVVAEFIDIPGNPCLQLNDGMQEILIPFREEMMTIDHKKKTITTNLPEGLVDVNRKP
jgi:ribosomal 30S subunit maturation factor RimM